MANPPSRFITGIFGIKNDMHLSGLQAGFFHPGLWLDDSRAKTELWEQVVKHWQATALSFWSELVGQQGGISSLAKYARSALQLFETKELNQTPPQRWQTAHPQLGFLLLYFGS